MNTSYLPAIIDAYLLFDSTDKKNETWNYNEKEAAASGILVEAGHTLIDQLFSK